MNQETPQWIFLKTAVFWGHSDGPCGDNDDGCHLLLPTDGQQCFLLGRARGSAFSFTSRFIKMSAAAAMTAWDVRALFPGSTDGDESAARIIRASLEVQL